MLIVGVTGNVGCGKSTVIGLFRDKDVHIANIDDITNGTLYTNINVRSEIIKLFGKKSYSKDIKPNKSYIANKIFQKTKKANILRKKLEQMLKPIVMDCLNRWIANRKEVGEKILIIEAPLLFETKMQNFFDAIITIYADDKVVERRCKKELLKRRNFQMSLTEKMSLSNFVINNSGKKKQTSEQVDFIYNCLKGLSDG